MDKHSKKIAFTAFVVLGILIFCLTLDKSSSEIANAQSGAQTPAPPQIYIQTFSAGAYTKSPAPGPVPGNYSITAWSDGTYTWTVPLGVTSVVVHAWGGGGAGGGGGISVNAAGSGGGGGGYARSTLAVTPGATYTLVVGAGGIVQSGCTGRAGGTASFGPQSGAPLVSATGGGGGGAGGCANATVPGAGGVGSGQFTSSGQAGAYNSVEGGAGGDSGDGGVEIGQGAKSGGGNPDGYLSSEPNSSGFGPGGAGSGSSYNWGKYEVAGNGASVGPYGHPAGHGGSGEIKIEAVAPSTCSAISLAAVGAAGFNPQTSLDEYTVKVTNTGLTTLPGIRLVTEAAYPVDSGAMLWPAAGTDSTGKEYVQYNAPLSPGQSVDIHLRYYSKTGYMTGIALSAVVVAPVAEPILPSGATLVTIDRRLKLPDGSVLLEWSTGGVYTNNGYAIQYSDDGSTWHTVGGVDSGIMSAASGANRIQWIDAGGWQVYSFPTDARQYRVYLLPNAYSSYTGPGGGNEVYAVSCAQPCNDIGLRLKEAGASAPTILAAEPVGTMPMSPLRISKDNKTYGITLVPPSDPNATSARVKLASGSIMAIGRCTAPH